MAVMIAMLRAEYKWHMSGTYSSKLAITRVCYYPRRARSAIVVDTVLTLYVCLYGCMYVSALERKRLIGMT